MKGISGILDFLDLKHKRSLRLGLLSLSALFIISASALVYASMIYEKALRVSSTSGVTTGSGSTVSAEASLTPVAVMMLAVAGLVIGLSMFGFLREASRRISNAPGGRGLPLRLPSEQGEEWEESPTKDEGEEEELEESPAKDEGEE